MAINSVQHLVHLLLKMTKKDGLLSLAEMSVEAISLRSRLSVFVGIA